MRFFFTLLFLSYLLMGCNKSDSSVRDFKLDNILTDINLSTELETSLEPLWRISNGQTIFSFVNNFDKGEGVFVIKSSLNKEEPADVGVGCSGTCPSVKCKQSGQIDIDLSDGDQTYFECSGCNECKMIMTFPKASTSLSMVKPLDIEDIARRSYERTFLSKTNEISITKSEYHSNESFITNVLYYVGDNGKESTVMIYTALKSGLNISGVKTAAKKSYEIDCTGTCECRERAFPATGAVECTCDQCKMTVTEIEESQPANP